MQDATATTLVMQCTPTSAPQYDDGIPDCEDEDGARYQYTVTFGPSTYRAHMTRFTWVSPNSTAQTV
jgi:hypothetical protein